MKSLAEESVVVSARVSVRELAELDVALTRLGAEVSSVSALVGIAVKVAAEYVGNMTGAGKIEGVAEAYAHLQSRGLMQRKMIGKSGNRHKVAAIIDSIRRHAGVPEIEMGESYRIYCSQSRQLEKWANEVEAVCSMLHSDSDSVVDTDERFAEALRWKIGDDSGKLG